MARMPGDATMSFALYRRVTLQVLAVVCTLASAQAATPVPEHEPGNAHVPHFGKGGVKVCVPRARERIKAVMNGDSAGRFGDQLWGTNSSCK
jgi:hypothetical protein